MRIRFDRGTLVLEAESSDEDPAEIPEATRDHDQLAWRVPAHHYASLVVRLADSGGRISDETRTTPIAGPWNLPELRWYQREGLAAWERARRRGVLALPTGAGKTLAAMAAIASLGVSTLVLVPTRILLDQWARTLSAAWPYPIGRIGDGERQIAPVTVATFASAITWAPRIGDRFGLVVVDEAHHVGAMCPTEVLEMLVAPYRLGLTATPPTEPATLERLAQFVGPVVYGLSIDDLAGDALASYQLVTVPIRLARDERELYREHRERFTAVYAPYMRASRGAAWHEFVRDARQSRAGRDALASWRTYRGILAYPRGKRAVLRRILALHPDQRTLIFTGDNATAYAIARELLVQPITHEIGKAERAAALARFREGTLSVLVSSQVLDEGIDVPDADIAIIVGGTASARRHVQRIGRVLRPRDGKRARVYELAVEDSTETRYVAQRRSAVHRAPLTVASAAGGAP